VQTYLVNFINMWDLRACSRRIKPEFEFESNFSTTSQHVRSTEYSNFQKFLRIRCSEIECEVILAVYHSNLMAIHFLITRNF